MYYICPYFLLKPCRGPLEFIYVKHVFFLRIYWYRCSAWSGFGCAPYVSDDWAPPPPHIELLLPSYQIASKKLEKNCSIGWDDEESSMSHISDCHSWYKVFIYKHYWASFQALLSRWVVTNWRCQAQQCFLPPTLVLLQCLYFCQKTCWDFYGLLMQWSCWLKGVLCSSLEENSMHPGCFEALKYFLPYATRDQSLP